MSTGKRLSSLLLLTSALAFPAAAFAQSAQIDPPATDPGDAVAPISPEEEPQDEQADVSIPGGGGEIIVTGRRNRDVTRSSTQVVSVLSSEQIARTGEGDIAGALGRVTGLSVQGNGFVFVRGLGDRYSLALLNGLPLPSPQPLSRVVPLDIFPTNIIASSLVQKTYSANFPGEFGGGVINLTTRAVPEESFLKISAGISGDEQTTLSEGYDYYGSDYDSFGFDDGTRDAPPALQSFFDNGIRMSDLTIDEQVAIGKQLGNPNLVLTQRVGDIPFNFSGGITAGTAVDVGSDGRFGVIATASISNKWRNRSITKQTPISADLNIGSDEQTFSTDNRILVNALLGFGLELGEHKFRWTNLFIRDTLKQTQLSSEEDFISGFTNFGQDTGWFERQLLDSQVVAEMKFGDLGLELRGGYAETQREAPYEYSFNYTRTNNPADPLGDTFVNVLDRQRGSASVVFSDLKEELWYGGLDVNYPLTDWLRMSAGYAYTTTDRFSSRREFQFDAPTSFDDGVGALRPDLLLGDAVLEFYDIGLIETTQSDPAFDAALDIQAGYVSSQITPLLGVTLDLGVRYEDAKQTVTPVEIFATPINSGSATSLSNDYFFPAGTLTYEVADGVQLRVSASKTIARPQFRELIFQTYYDPETNRQYNGNPLLQDSQLTNLEARAEYYFGRSNRVSLAGFYKDIENPIEAYSSFNDNEQITSYANAPSARLYGAELEFQYNYDLIDLGNWFESKRAVVVANYTYTQSSIRVGPDDVTQIFPGGSQAASNFFVDDAPLTGQSDHLVNLQLGMEDIDRLQQFTFLMSYSSERVTSRGAGGLPDIVEDPGFRLDFVARQGLDLGGVPLELKLEARNIFGRDNFEFQTDGTNRIEINTYEVGQSFSLSVSAEF